MILNVHVQYLQHTTEYTKPLYWKRLTIKKKQHRKFCLLITFIQWVTGTLHTNNHYQNNL